MSWTLLAQWAFGFTVHLSDTEVIEDAKPMAAAQSFESVTSDTVVPAIDWPNDLGVCYRP